MSKNVIITILTIIVVILWLRVEPEDISDDPNDVVIEYQCSDLGDYHSVPTEVIEECRQRGLLKNSI